MNTFGERLRLTTFGESHGEAIGGIIDGFPSGFVIERDFIYQRMAERKPGKRATSARNEEDMPVILSGINADNVTLGTPVGFIIKNTDTRSEDYALLEHSFRPNHADYSYFMKYGIRDARGGGRASARETACRVFAGALCEQYLKTKNISINAWISQIGSTKGTPEEMMEIVERTRKDKDSIGGIVACEIKGLEAGLGEPVYNKLSSRLAFAMMSINASKGFEIGDGFEMATRNGSEVIDPFFKDNKGKICTRSNHNGGVLGGISTGMPLNFKVAFKPTPTIGMPVPLLHEDGTESVETINGRHDPCVAVRAVPVVRAMAALVIMDFII